MASKPAWISETTESGNPDKLSDGDNGLLEVGRIIKPHGLRGEVVVDLFTPRAERVSAGSWLQSEVGSFKVERSKPFGKRWIVQFVGVSDRETAERIRGTVLMAEGASEQNGLWVHELVGAEVVDSKGEPIGKVRSVIANPASDLLELEEGGLIPLAFVLDQSGSKVVVEIPDGLLEL